MAIYPEFEGATVTSVQLEILGGGEGGSRSLVQTAALLKPLGYPVRTPWASGTSASVQALPGRLRNLSAFHSKSIFYGAFVGAQGA